MPWEARSVVRAVSTSRSPVAGPLEILIVAFVIYRLLLVLVGTRALQIVFGLLVLAAIYFAALLLKLTMITYL